MHRSVCRMRPELDTTWFIDHDHPAVQEFAEVAAAVAKDDGQVDVLVNVAGVYSRKSAAWDQFDSTSR